MFKSVAEDKELTPDNLLVPTDPKKLDYGRNPYVGSDQSAFLYRGDLPKDIEPMARVVVVRPILGKPKAVTLELLRAKGLLVLDDVGLAWQAGQASALGHWAVARGRDVGTVTAYTEDPDGPLCYVRLRGARFPPGHTHPQVKSLCCQARIGFNGGEERGYRQCAGPFGACWACST
jgi:hypothetical protein